MQTFKMTYSLWLWVQPYAEMMGSDRLMLMKKGYGL